MPLPPTPALQSVMLDAVIASVASLIQLGTTLAPSNLSELNNPLDISKILVWFGEDTPDIRGQQFISYGFYDVDPRMFAGAGRLAPVTNIVLGIKIWTKYAVDPSGSQQIWFNAQARGHWLRYFQVLNAFDNQWLSTSYDANLTPTGSPLSIRPMQDVTAQFAKSDKKDPTWGSSLLLFQVPLVKPILQPAP